MNKLKASENAACKLNDLPYSTKNVIYTTIDVMDRTMDIN